MHALGAHAVQLLPGLAWLLVAAGLDRAAVGRRLALATGGGGAWLAGWAWLAWRAVPFGEAPPATWAMLGLAVSVGAVVAADALRRVRAGPQRCRFAAAHPRRMAGRA